MSSSDSEVTFEVHILQNGRWEVHGGYSADKQAQAIKDAKALEAISTITGVKVVREERNNVTGDAIDNNIYASKSLPDEQPKGKQEAKKTNPTGGGKPAKAAGKKSKPAKKPVKAKAKQKNLEIPQSIADYDPDAEPEKKFSLFGVFIKLLLVVLFSAIIASLVTGLASVWLRESAFRANTQSNIIFGLFVGTFAFSVFSMGMSFLKKAKLKVGTGAPRPQRPAKPMPEKKPEKKKEDYTFGGDDAIDDFGQETGDDTEEEEKKDDGPFNPFAEEDAGADTDTDDRPDDDKTDSETDSEADAGLDEPWVAKQTDLVLKYLSSSLEQAGINRAELDNFNKFGVSLFMAGACESLSQARNMDARTMSKVLSAPIKQMGFRKKDTEAFSDKVQSYLLVDSRYMKIFQEGRSSMSAYLEGDPECLRGLTGAMKEWNRPKSTNDVKTGPVTVLFTDIAGSTNMTQTLGDAVAQQIVRAHNRIVRDALSKFHGKEIKHTGDGIMASFANTSNGIEAAADMQVGTQKHNATNPDLPLGLKIGLNAGEPIEEDDDLFGTTVQLAARIVDKAQAGQVYLSETVQGICSGKTYKFSNRGGFDFKGFDSKITIYELNWDKTAAVVEPAKAAEEEPEEIEIGADLKNEADAKDEPEEEAVEEADPQEEPSSDEDTSAVDEPSVEENPAAEEDPPVDAEPSADAEPSTEEKAPDPDQEPEPEPEPEGAKQTPDA